MSIGHEALRLLLVELGRSAARWAARLVFVNGHGGNVPTLVDAVALLRYEGRDAAWFPCAPGGDAHAGRTETSLVLALDPRSSGPAPQRGTPAPLARAAARDARGRGGGGEPERGARRPGRGVGGGGGAAARGDGGGADAALARWTPDPTGRLR